MKKNGKLFIAFLSFGLCLTACSLLPSNYRKSKPEEAPQQQEEQNEFETKTREIYELYRANGGELTYEQWLESIRGQDGRDGQTPYIGDNGHWFIGDTDTGVPAKGEAAGKDGIDGKDGVDGKDGADGQTPYIGANGHWWIGETDTNVSATGEKGADGVSIASTVINSEGNLIVTFSDGNQIDAGKVQFTEHVHEYTSSVTEPTCTKDGMVTFTCKTCGHIETVINKATGHVFETWRESIPATCTSDGLKVRYCSLCGQREQETIPMHEHTVSTTCIHNSATHWYYCTECGVVLNESNHSYVNNSCSTCGYAFKENTGDSGMIYSLNSDGNSYTLADLGTCKDTEIEVPDLYNGKPVTAIGQGAFANSNITSITMTDNIVSIGAGCFKQCGQLASVVLSKNITKIENSVFYYCGSLSNITIPNGVTSIGESSFESTAITSIVFPDSVKTLSYRAFVSCSQLTRVVLPASLEDGGSYAFAWCYSLQEVTIPEGCKALGWSMFESCAYLQSVYIPASLERINTYSFRDCSRLTSVIFGDPDNWYVGETKIPKEVLQDEEVAARKVIALSENEWIHRAS